MAQLDLENVDLGSIQISPEVIGAIAALAAIEVPGVAGMSGGFTGGIAQLLGRKNLSKGVKVEVGETQTAVTVSIIISYGERVPEVCFEVQRIVKQAVENMAGLTVVEVNVVVEGVQFPSI
ncbi:MAG: hypothetical protein RLZZ267_729 [Bacillota bacterium]|jgi:uncharacterized alkaline shock family protein YloU